MARAFQLAHADLVQFFVEMAVEFDARMALPINADKVIQDIHPSPQITGFQQVPLHFRPVAFKFIARALNRNNFNLDSVFSSDFEFIHQQPQLLAMQGQIVHMQGQIDEIRGDIAEIRVGITAILNRLNMAPNA